MEEVIRILAHYIALVAEAMAILFIVIGMGTGAVDYVREGMLQRRTHRALAQIRNDLGHMLSVGLEFLIGADILKTAISPTWTEIGQLAAIVAIRTVLNFFLMRELKPFAESEAETPATQEPWGYPAPEDPHHPTG